MKSFAIRRGETILNFLLTISDNILLKCGNKIGIAFFLNVAILIKIAGFVVQSSKMVRGYFIKTKFNLMTFPNYSLNIIFPLLGLWQIGLVFKSRDCLTFTMMIVVNNC